MAGSVVPTPLPASTLRAAGSVPPGRDAKAEAAIDKAAREFESVFLGMVVNEMMKDTMPKDMNGGRGEEIFRSVLGNEIGATLAETGGIGIAGSVAASMRAYRP